MNVAGHTRILPCIYSTADADFVLHLVSRSLESYEEFTREFFWESPHIKNFKTMVVMENLKFGFELPVED